VISKRASEAPRLRRRLPGPSQRGRARRKQERREAHESPRITTAETPRPRHTMATIGGYRLTEGPKPGASAGANKEHASWSP